MQVVPVQDLLGKLRTLAHEGIIRSVVLSFDEFRIIDADGDTHRLSRSEAQAFMLGTDIAALSLHDALVNTGMLPPGPIL